MSNMFASCKNLETLDFSGFGRSTQYLTNISQMFAYCEKIQTLDLTHFYTTKVTDMFSLFRDCKALVTIYASTGFTTNQLKTSLGCEYLFYGCESLIGGNPDDPTPYNSDFYRTEGTYTHSKDYHYARIDGGKNSSTYGYFTAVPSDSQN